MQTKASVICLPSRFGGPTADGTEVYTNAVAIHDRQDRVVRRREEECPGGNGLNGFLARLGEESWVREQYTVIRLGVLGHNVENRGNQHAGIIYVSRGRESDGG